MVCSVMVWRYAAPTCPPGSEPGDRGSPLGGGGDPGGVNDWVASGPAPLWATTVRGNVPGADGVPARVAVPLPLSVKVPPGGRAPDSVRVAVGEPPVLKVNFPAAPAWKLVD